jgi:glucose/arabinose dehydrogenase
MQAERRIRVILVALALAAPLALVAAVAAQAGDTLVAANGNTVEVVANNVETPTAFAWGDGTMFVGKGPSLPNFGPGGLDTIVHGVATAVPNGPQDVYGLAWHDGSLYVSTGLTIIKLGGWNGSTFATDATVYADSSPSFSGFSGIAFGPDGRLYAGLLAKEPDYDHAKDPYPLSQSVVSMNANGTGLRLIARGIRQPFQLHFPAGSRYPFVSDLGQDAGGPTPPDEILVAKPKQNYGFPTCTWRPTQTTACRHFTKPLILLPQHASPMGISSIRNTLYVALYTGVGKSGPEVVKIPTAGGPVTPFVTGFSSPIISLSVQDGYVYIGEQSGTIYRVYS